MGKYNIDDILSELGIDEDLRNPEPAAASAPAPAPAPATAAAAAPAPAPAEPAPTNLPAVAPQRTARAGGALSAVYDPGQGAGEGAGIGESLVASGAITAQQLAAAQQIIRQTPGRRLAEVLVEQGADEAEVQRAVAESAGLPFERIDLEKGLEGGFDGALLQRLGFDFCRQQVVVPLRKEGSRAVVGAVRPDDVFLLDEIKQRLGVPSVKLVLVTSYDVRGALEIVGEDKTDQEQVDLNSILSQVEDNDVQVEKTSEETVDLEKEAGESPVIRYVNYIIQSAVKEGASDIHIEPSEKKLKVRFRIDGELYEMMHPPASMAAAITSRLKIMANLDISERRIPQDGRVRCTVQGRKLDLRMSTLPNGHGEKTVLRILDTRSINVELEDLGFEPSTYEVWKKLIDAPHGIVLVTGPTGSGKTTTLYSSLRQLDKTSMNICTVEDPVEYHLDGITQTQVHEKIGMTFAAALRALLRQDPDVIMLGEIRDHETALIAVQAALTGHLVLSTLHTNDAPSSITRLVNIGLEPFLVGAAVNGVLAQRLVRRLCAHCKQQEKPSDELADFLTMQGMETDAVWVGRGCDRCRHSGFSGRVGIYELLTTDDSLRDIIARNPNVAEFRRMCIERGMVTLRGDGLRKVAQGLTTVPEILRVTEANA